MARSTGVLRPVLQQKEGVQPAQAAWKGHIGVHACYEMHIRSHALQSYVLRQALLRASSRATPKPEVTVGCGSVAHPVGSCQESLLRASTETRNHSAMESDTDSEHDRRAYGQYTSLAVDGDENVDEEAAAYLRAVR